MKKILTFDKGALGEWYDGLKCYRLEQAGRLELLRVLNDPPPYWFVIIRNFNQSPTGPDRMALQGLTTAWGNGVWRFLDEGKARAKFEQFSQLPIFIAEHAKDLKRRTESSERLKAGALERWTFQKDIFPAEQAVNEAIAAGGRN